MMIMLYSALALAIVSMFFSMLSSLLLIYREWRVARIKKLPCNRTFMYAEIKRESYVDEVDAEGFELIRETTDGSGTIPAIRIGDGEYVMLFETDITYREVRRK